MSRSEAEQRGREQIVARCRQLYDRGLIVAADGNVSLRLDEDRILITASGVEKGRMSLEDVL
ncbi:MAG: class II aldolase/adducin family protein, partial [Planctomycetota bacterium]